MPRLCSRLTNPLLRTSFFSGIIKYVRYLRDWKKYTAMQGAEALKFKDAYPILFDRKSKTGIDKQYFYQDVWAFEKIYNSKPQVHVDVGSSVKWVSLLTVISKVQFIDIRPLEAPYLKNIECIKGSILEMPYPDNSVKSVSCLNVAEHIGLGRYGDPIDPLGTKKAAAELTRCLAPGGNLFFSLPVGKPCVCFNAHRVHDPETILQYFEGLQLVEFSCSDDDKKFTVNADMQVAKNADFACGMFWFTKK